MTGPLYGRRGEICKAISEASTAAAELVHTCPDDILREEKAQLEAQMADVYERLTAIRSRVAYMAEEARLQRLRADRELTVESGDGPRDVAARYQENADAARREEKNVDKLIAELVKRREQLEQRMRDA